MKILFTNKEAYERVRHYLQTNQYIFEAIEDCDKHQYIVIID